MEVLKGNFEGAKQSLGTTELHKNSPEPLKSPEQLINIVILASSSPRRKAFVEYIFPDKQVEIVPAGKELETHDVSLIALNKAHQALSIQTAKNSVVDKDSTTLILAADTRASIPSIKDNKFNLVSSGKPMEPRGFIDSLLQVCLLPNLVEQQSHYRLDSGSAHLIFESGSKNQFPKVIFEKEQALVTLKAEKAAYLATSDGQEHYLQEFYDFYSSSPYTEHNMPAIDPTFISAGISLPVLSRLGAIGSIDNISQNDPYYKDVLRKAIFLAAVGFSHRILKPFVSDIENRIENWSWLDKVTHKALNENTDKMSPKK